MDYVEAALAVARTPRVTGKDGKRYPATRGPASKVYPDRSPAAVKRR